mgnify:CR=1 FL=1
MSDVYIMTTIIDRKNSKKYIDLYKKDKLEVMYITLGEGTARGDILDYLGLEASEKMVIFNFVQQHDWMLTKKDLQRPGDWNTYLNKGLPPTPISMPSAASIEAAAHPEPSKYLYFVSRGDGTSEFSTNLRDHNRAVNRFILKRGAPAKSVQTDKPASAAKAPQNASKPASVE